MKNTIEKIISGEDVIELINHIMDHIYAFGPSDPVDLELLTYLKIYQPGIFDCYEKSILTTMGLFFKKPVSILFEI